MTANMAEHLAPVAPGDVVQFRPDVDAKWAGCYATVTRVTPGYMEGFIPVPARAGIPAHEAFIRFPAYEVARVGRAPYPEGEYERKVYMAKDKPWWGNPVSRASERLAAEGWEVERVGEVNEEGEIPITFRRRRMR